MYACAFFGHHDCTSDIRGRLIEEIERLITDEQVSEFYVGNQGNFDMQVISALEELEDKYTQIKCFVVLAYYQAEKSKKTKIQTIYPFGIEKKPRRFAIPYRNSWMVKRSQYIISYCKNDFSYTAKILRGTKGKSIINIAE